MLQTCKKLSSLVLVFSSFLLSSCAGSYEYAVPRAPEDSSVLGKYLYEDEEGAYEISLLDNGHFLERLYLAEEDGWVSLIGKYFVESERHKIFFYQNRKAKELDHTAFIASADTLIVDDLELHRIDDKVVNITSQEQVAGDYFLEYYDEERVLLKLTLYSDGRFEEFCSYPDSKEEYFEKGSYELSIPSGLISFRYDEWEEGNHHAVLDAFEGIIYCSDGDYRKIGSLIQMDNASVSI